ncbi:MAG: tetratricopeptide repeat protein [Proteobacteria bacterium]|nr:tetratricopeptide repeat protein [Pseudomonadota bacterium]
MANEFIQPLQNIGPMAKESGGAQEEESQAKKDYREGRKLHGDREYAQAAIAFHNALRGFEEQGDQAGVANSSDRLGDACLARGEYAMAIANYQRAHAICEQEDDSFSILALNKKMASAYRKLGDQGKALELLYDILEHYRLTSNPKGAVEVLIVIGETYLEQGDGQKAADAYRSVASIHARFKHARLAEEFARRAAELEQGA